jgi:hypothetical protein
MRPILFLLLLLASFSVLGQATKADPPIHEVWVSMIDFAGITSEEIVRTAPSFPAANPSLSEIESWIKSNPGEVEKFMLLFNEHKVFPTNRQLGLDIPGITYKEVAPYWPQAIEAFGSLEQIQKELPNMPLPFDHGTVAEFEADIAKFDSWRVEGEEVDLSLVPNDLDLFDTRDYPALGSYKNAIFTWVAVHPAEYWHLLSNCNCGEVEVPDDLEDQAALSEGILTPMEELLINEANAKLGIESSVQELEEDYEENVEDVHYIPYPNSAHPLDVLKKNNSALTVAITESVLSSSGPDGYWKFLKENLTYDEARFVYTSSVLWYKHNQSQKYAVFASWSKGDYTSESGAVEYILALEEGIVEMKSVSDDVYISMYNEVSK